MKSPPQTSALSAKRTARGRRFGTLKTLERARDERRRLVDEGLTWTEDELAELEAATLRFVSSQRGRAIRAAGGS
jgi:hypothetical protein